MLNLTFVRTFVTLAETLSFIEAARRLDLAQSTVSLQLKKLEATLGVSLVERSHAGCELTPRGRSVLPHAKALLKSADALSNAADGRKITIGCSGNIAAYYISEDLKRFIDAEDQGLAWSAEVAPNPQVLDLLVSGAVDIAAMEWRSDDPSLNVVRWRTEPLVVIVPSDHPFARARSISAKELTSLALIGGEPGSGTGTLLKQSLGSHARKLNITQTLHSTEAVKSAVRAGLGCSIVLAGAVRAEADAGHLAALPVKGVKLEKTFYLATQKGLPETALAARLATFLSEQSA